jgi:hypothetical protein
MGRRIVNIIRTLIMGIAAVLVFRGSRDACLAVDPDHLLSASNQQCEYVRLDPDQPHTHQDSLDPAHPARSISAGVQGRTFTVNVAAATAPRAGVGLRLGRAVDSRA